MDTIIRESINKQDDYDGIDEARVDDTLEDVRRSIIESLPSNLTNNDMLISEADVEAIYNDYTHEPDRGLTESEIKQNENVMAQEVCGISSTSLSALAHVCSDLHKTESKLETMNIRSSRSQSLDPTKLSPPASCFNARTTQSPHLSKIDPQTISHFSNLTPRSLSTNSKNQSPNAAHAISPNMFSGFRKFSNFFDNLCTSVVDIRSELYSETLGDKLHNPFKKPTQITTPIPFGRSSTPVPRLLFDNMSIPIKKSHFTLPLQREVFKYSTPTYQDPAAEHFRKFRASRKNDYFLSLHTRSKQQDMDPEHEHVVAELNRCFMGEPDTQAVGEHFATKLGPRLKRHVMKIELYDSDYSCNDIVDEPVILRDLLCTQEYDFIDYSRECKTINIKKRFAFYDSILERYISTDYLAHSFIAGGFFTKYVRAEFDDDVEYNRASKCQNTNIYVDITMGGQERGFSFDFDQFLQIINNQEPNIKWEYFLSNVLITLEVAHGILVHICTVDCIQMLQLFTFRPSRIGYAYKKKKLFMSKFFQSLGSYYDKDCDRHNPNLIELAQKYYKKNFKCDGIAPADNCDNKTFILDLAHMTDMVDIFDKPKVEGAGKTNAEPTNARNNKRKDLFDNVEAGSPRGMTQCPQDKKMKF